MDTSPTTITMNELTQKGRQFYLEELKDKLEKTNMDNWIVIEPEGKKYFLDEDQLKAIQKAKREFPNKLFFIAKVGNLRETLVKPKKNDNYLGNFLMCRGDS